MINLVNSMTDAVKSLNEINEKLTSQESAISCQKGEIVKTEAIIKQYQDWLKSQNDMLGVFTKQKEQIEEEKAKILKLIQDYNNASNNSTKDVICSDGNDNKSKPLSFEETYQISKIVKPVTYYQEIIDRLSEVSPHNEVNYLNQTMIPNKLKASTAARRMVLYRIDKIGEYPLDEIIRQPITMSIDIHVSTGYGELLSIRGEEPLTEYHATRIQCCNSFSISQSQTIGTKFIMLISIAPMVMAFDILNQTECSYENSFLLLEKEGYAAIPPVNISDYPDCFMKRNLSQKEINEKLLFIDASFAHTVQGSLAPISIAAINYEGTIVIKSLMCPRAQISSFCEMEHGVFEKDVIGASDSEKVLRQFYRLAWDKILVGHNLKEKLRDLKIDMKYICGVRDLQSCSAIREVINPNKPTFTITEIVNRLINIHRPNGVYSAEHNAQTIRKAYFVIESKWRDSISVEELISQGNSKISNESFSRWDSLKPSSAKTSYESKKAKFDQ